MIVLITGTNRPESNSKKINEFCFSYLESKNVVCKMLHLEQLPTDFIFSDAYGKVRPEMEQYREIIKNANKLVFIIPEYNGSFPGVLKSFIDVVSPKFFEGKRAALIGLSSGHAGASRAMDQFTDILHYLKVEVFSNKPKLSGIVNLLKEDVILEENSASRVKEQLNQFLLF